MHTVALFGSGKIGEAISALLSNSGRYTVRICDMNIDRAKLIAEDLPETTAHTLDLKDTSSTRKLLIGADAVISALPYYCNQTVANYAKETQTHYFDLTEDVATSHYISTIANDSDVVFMPQCGLAPGFISVAAYELVRSFDTVDTVKMRVGALPIYPSNRLKYNLTWSTEGLINEYGNLCEIIDNRQKMLALPLEGLEYFSLDGDEYEAFNTSGGLGTLCDTLAGRVRNLNYKSVRYPGHREQIALLMNDLRFNEDRETLKKVFERSIATTDQDKSLILVEVNGFIKQRFVQKTYASTVYNSRINGKHFGSIQITTASGILAPMDLVLTNALGRQKGFLKAEDIALKQFLDNEFGKYYYDEKALRGL
jgi:saccharopine dehydrogenase-like NADP-dependent oxidoreductase